MPSHIAPGWNSVWQDVIVILCHYAVDLLRAAMPVQFFRRVVQLILVCKFHGQQTIC